MTPLLILLAALAAVWVVSVYLAGARAAEITERYPPEGAFIDAGSARLHVVEKGQGPAVVLIHGASGNARDFTFQLMDQLATSYRVIAVDRPGMGHSPHLDPRYDTAFSNAAEPIRDQARAIRDAITGLGVRDPIVLGHSFGGAVALAWAVDALDEPETAPAALVLLGSVGMEWPGEVSTLYRINGTRLGGLLAVPPIAAFVPTDYLRDATRRAFEPNEMPDGYATHIGGGLAARPQTLRANARHVRSLKPQIIAQQRRYPDLTLPIEWIHGSSDTTVPAAIHAVPFGQIVDSANIELLDGVGHMPHHVRPDLVFDAVDRAARRADLRR